MGVGTTRSNPEDTCATPTASTSSIAARASAFCSSSTFSTGWRTGGGADVYRTTDSGAHWTDVAHLPPGASLQGRFVRDADTALYVLAQPGTDHVTLHLTTDGGATWTTLPFGR